MTEPAEVFVIELDVDASGSEVTLSQQDIALGKTAGAAQRLAREYQEMAAKMEATTASDRVKLRSVETMEASITRLISRTMTPYERALRDVERAEQLHQAAIKAGSAQADAAAAAVERLRARTEALKNSANDNATSFARLQAEAKQLVAAVDPMAAAQQRAREQIELANKAHAAGLISGPQHAAAMKMYGDAAKEAGGKVGLAAYQVTNLTAQIQDGFVQITGGQNPLMVLIQQGPQATAAMGGLGNAIKLLASPWTAVAAAAAAFLIPIVAGIARAADLAAETRALGVAIRGMGKDAEVSAGQLAAMVEQLRRQGIAAEEARKIATASVSNPLVSGARGQQLARLAPDVGAGAGIGAAEAMDKLVDAAARGYDGIKKLDEAWGFLTVRESEQIREMTRHGQTAAALDMAVDALRRRFGGLHDDALSPSAKSMVELANAWRDFTTAVAESKAAIGILDGIAASLGAIARVFKDFGYYMSGRALADNLAGLVGAGPVFGKPSERPKPLSGDDYARARRDASGQMPLDPTDEQRTKKLNDHVAAMQREQAVLRSALPDRARARAAIEAQDIAQRENYNTTQQGILQSALESKAMAEQADAIRQEAAALQRSTEAAVAQAEAWQRGGTAAAETAARAQAIEINETKARINVEAWTRAILNNRAAQATADLAKSNSELSERAVYLNRMIDAEKEGAKAVAEVELQEKQRLATKEAQAALAKEIDPERREQLEWEIKNTEHLTRTVADGEQQRLAAQSLRQRQQDLLIAQGERDLALETDPTKRAAMELTLQHRRDELAIREKFPRLGEEAIQQQLALADAAAKVRQETEQTNAIREKGKELFDDLANMVEQAGQKGGKGFFASFVDYGRAAIKTLAREMLFRPIIQPILTGIVGAVPQLFGLAGGAGTGAAGGAASGGLGSILSPITDAIGIAKSFLGDAIGGVSSWINGIGTSLGFGSGIAAAAPSAAFIGPMPLASGSMFGTTTLTGLLGGVGAGFGAGSLLNSLLGGSQVGGTIGSGIGSLGGALIGSIFPGVGTLLGGLLGGGAGGIIGGLFGKDESKPLGNARLGAVKDGKLSFGGSTTLDGYDNSREIAQMQQAVSLVNGIIDKFGLTLDEQLLKRGFEDTANPIGLIGKTSTFDGPKDLQEWIQRFFAGREGQSYLTGATGTLGTAMNRLAKGDYKPDDGDDVLKMLDFAGGFDDAAKRAGAGINTLARQLLEFDIAARDAGKSLAKSVKDYVDQAKKYFGDNSTEAAQAATTQRQSIYGMMGLGPDGAVAGPDDRLTGANAEVAQMTAQFKAMQPALEAAGLTAADATAAINRAIAARTAEIRAIEAETNQRTRAGLDQREVAAKIAAGRGGGANAYSLQMSILDEQQRQARYDADRAVESGAMTAANRARLEYILGLEREATVLAQAIQASDRHASQRQREVEAQLSMHTPGVERDTVEQYALGVSQWRELMQAQTEGWSAAEVAGLKYVQGLEAQALLYQQAERRLQTEEGYVSRTGQALAGMLQGSSIATWGQEISEDIDRQIKQAQELRAASTDAERARIREIQVLEDTAVIAQRAAEQQQKHNEALRAAKEQIDGFRKSINAWLDQQKLSQPGGANIAEGYDAAKSQYEEQLAKVKAGDTDAMQTLLQYAERFQQAAQERFTGGGTANLDAAKDIYDALVKRAKEGDAEAIQQVQQAADQYRQIALNTYASGEAYQTIKQGIIDTLKGLPDQLDPEQMAAKAIQKLEDELVPPTKEQLDVIRSLERLSMATKTNIGLANGSLDNMKAAADLFYAAQIEESKEANRIARDIRDKVGAPATPPPPPPSTGPSPQQAYSSLIGLAGTVQQTAASWQASGKTTAEIDALIEGQYGGYRDSLLDQMTPDLINQFAALAGWAGDTGPGPSHARQVIAAKGGTATFEVGGVGISAGGMGTAFPAVLHHGERILTAEQNVIFGQLAQKLSRPAVYASPANDGVLVLREMLAEMREMKKQAADAARRAEIAAALLAKAVKDGANQVSGSVEDAGDQQAQAFTDLKVAAIAGPRSK